MSPDRATIIAATPRCPVGPNRPGLHEEPQPCDKPLRLDAADDMWTCPDHGNVTTPQSLVTRQGHDTYLRREEHR